MRVALFCLLLPGLAWPAVGRAQTSWLKTYGAPTREESSTTGQLQPLRTGGFALVAPQHDAQQFGRIFLARVDAQGDTLWTRTLDTGSYPVVGSVSVAECRSGTLAVSCQGSFYWPNNLVPDYVGRLFLGLPQPAPTLQDQNRAYGSVVASPDGSLVCLYDTPWPAFSEARQLELRQIDSTGHVVWSTLLASPDSVTGYGPGSRGWAYTLAVVPDGYAVGCQTNQGNRVLTFDPAGQLLRRSQVWPGSTPTRLLRTPTNHLLLLDGGLTCLTPSGDTLWRRHYRSSQRAAQLAGATVTPDGHYVAVANYSAGGAGNQLPLFRIAPDGRLLGDTVLTLPWPAKARDIARDSAGNYVVFGHALTSPSQLFLLLVPAGSPLLATAGPWSVPSLAVWPNPAQRVVSLTSTTVPRTVVVTDGAGRAVRRLTPTAASTSLPVADLLAGLYVLRVTWPDGSTVTRRLVVMP